MLFQNYLSFIEVIKGNRIKKRIQEFLLKQY